MNYDVREDYPDPFKTVYRDCDDCQGTGINPESWEVSEQCTPCNGSGEIELTQDELDKLVP